LAIGAAQGVVAPELGSVVSLQHSHHFLEDLEQCRDGLLGELGG
jgi:hypothetical protein